MKEYKNFGELESAPYDIYNYFLKMECHEPPIDERPFEEYYGGNVYIVENLIDLIDIPTTVEAVGENRWKSITETPDSFDSCRYICDGRWVEIFMATTDAGGPSYFIPKALADQCPNVAKSIEMSKEAWG